MTRIRVVDDEAEKRAALVAALSSIGFDAHGVSSAEAPGSVGLELADEIALVDLMLHGTNGFELARRLRAASPRIRVVLMSDYYFTAQQIERVDCGAIGFVPRPFDLYELAEFLRAKLAQSVMPPRIDAVSTSHEARAGC